MGQPELFDSSFQTARPARPLFCHQEFLDKLSLRRNEPIGKRTALLLQRLSIDIARLHYKGTNGVNRGWRRSRLGGSSGSHFYAWWAPSSAAPLSSDSSFDGTSSETIFVRDIRHHDDHSPLGAGHFGNDYLQLNVADLRTAEYAPEPWTSAQQKFARSHSVARILKGHPGSGKTTALLHAADASHAERVLYVTYSPELAALARDHFDRYCSRLRTFTVLTYREFLQQLGGSSRTQMALDPKEARAQFRRDLQNYQRLLSPWSTDFDALYDEIHAHIIGAALPERSGRFPKAERVRLPEATYKAQRLRYLGTATNGVLEAMRRLDKAGEAPVADRYFPELAVAWRVAQGMTGKGPLLAFSNYGCIAVDEVQDLTPLEAFVVLKLARRLNEGGAQVPLMLAGDEAQTVRATDFEWAWLNDMLHSTVSQPQEFKMAVNLRSPRRIANLVNRSWEFYDFLSKQDRPSGVGYAEIEDDSPDQILYATLPPSELPKLLGELSQREGLAMIAFDKANLPAAMLPFVLSPSEAKGLDFHSVCVLNGGPLLRRIVSEPADKTTGALSKRLAIDQLRVVLSRPTERLVWLDVAPDAITVEEVGQLLRSTGDAPLPPMSAEALRTSLEEEELDVEERIQRCQCDARQLVTVKPDLAWSRAHQAVALLGSSMDLGAVTDKAVREGAHLTLTEVCFLLALRKQTLSPELGHPNLIAQAYEAARQSGKLRLAYAIRTVGLVDVAGAAIQYLNRLAEVVQAITAAREELPGWFLVEVTPKALGWIEELERNLDAGDNPVLAQEIMPPFFDALGLPDAKERKEKLAARSIQLLIKARKFAQALVILDKMPDAKPALKAECLEEIGEFAKAAAVYLELGDRAKALKCYRSIPDFDAALQLVRQIDDHPARASLEWLADLNKVLERRPDGFNRAMTMPEKKLLEGMLERGLGVKKKKAAAAKKAVQKPAAAAKKRAAPQKRS